METQLRLECLAELIRGNNDQESLNPEFYRDIAPIQHAAITLNMYEDILFQYQNLIFVPNADNDQIITNAMEVLPGKHSREKVAQMLLNVRKFNRQKAFENFRFMDETGRKFTGIDGTISDYGEFYAFLGLGKNIDPKEEIIIARKVFLAHRIITEKDGQILAKLRQAATSIGLIDSAGNWLDSEIYLAARIQWMKSQADNGTLPGYLDNLLKEYTSMPEGKMKEIARKELSLFGFGVL